MCNDKLEKNDDFDVWVRRQWNDTLRIGKVKFSDIADLHWDCMSGGVYSIAPRSFIHGYIMCTAVTEGEVAHSCRHGKPPHFIKICITKIDNSPEAFEKIKAVVDAKKQVTKKNDKL